MLKSLKGKIEIYLNANVWPWKVISDLKADVDDARNSEQNAKRDMHAAFDIIGSGVSWKFHQTNGNPIVIHSGIKQTTKQMINYSSGPSRLGPQVNELEVETHTLIPYVENRYFSLLNSRSLSSEPQSELRRCLVDAAHRSMYKHIEDAVDDMMNGKYDERPDSKAAYPF